LLSPASLPYPGDIFVPLVSRPWGRFGCRQGAVALGRVQASSRFRGDRTVWRW